MADVADAGLAPSPTSAQPPAFGAVATAAPDPAPGLRSAIERLKEKEAERAAILTPTITKTQEGIQKSAVSVPPLPEPPTLAPPPSPKLRDFLAPGKDDTPENSIQKFIQGVGLLATGARGLAGGDARAALASLSGALKGWHEGDKERANRELTAWRENTDRLLANWKMFVEHTRAIREDVKMDIDTKTKVMELEALKAGLPIDAAKTDVEGQKALQEVIDRNQAHVDALQLHRDQILGARQRAEELDQIRRDQLAESKRFHDQLIVKAAVDRATREEAHTDKMEDLEPGTFYDKDSGSLRRISRREAIEDNKRAQAGKPTRFTAFTQPTQASLVGRLALTPPILDRMDQLIDRITKAAPGENITQGLVNKLINKAGIGEDIREFQSLNVDALVELTGSLSGGQPRIAIMRILKGEALPDDSATTAVAKKQVQTMRTTVKNRITMETDDPDAMEKLSKKLGRYRDSPTQAAQPRAVLVGPDGKEYDGSGVDASRLKSGWRLMQR